MSISLQKETFRISAPGLLLGFKLKLQKVLKPNKRLFAVFRENPVLTNGVVQYSQ